MIKGKVLRYLKTAWTMIDSKREDNKAYWNPENTVLSKCCLQRPLPFTPNPDEGLALCSKCFTITELYYLPEILDYILEYDW